jgi:hypothetical protein
VDAVTARAIKYWSPVHRTPPTRRSDFESDGRHLQRCQTVQDREVKF